MTQDPTGDPGLPRYPCVCCGHVVHSGPPGSDGICPVCGWQDDLSQLRFPLAAGGANRKSLVAAQEDLLRAGTSHSSAPQDPAWRPIDLSADRFEVPVSGRDYGGSYPTDLTRLYYWTDA